ncbi:MAG: sulfotransferase [Candidatus Woesearchaeota archaeon]
MKKPNLFIVGFPKSGTTAMYEYLKQHPQVFMSDYKEPRFFATDLHKESDSFRGEGSFFPVRTLPEYLKLFEGAGSRPVIGEASPHYIISKDAASNIHRFNPSAKILILVREPVGFLQSFHSEMVFNLHETEKDMEKALALESERRKGKNLPESAGTPSLLYYSEWLKYSDNIRRYLREFPRKQVKIIIFDDFRRDNHKVCRDIYRFLGIDDSFRPSSCTPNPNKELRFAFLKAFLRKPLVWRIIHRVIPLKLYGLVENIFKKLFMKEAPRKKISPHLRRKLMRKYKPEVKKVSRLLGRDLVSMWGYDKV